MVLAFGAIGVSDVFGAPGNKEIRGIAVVTLGATVGAVGVTRGAGGPGVTMEVEDKEGVDVEATTGVTEGTAREALVAAERVRGAGTGVVDGVGRGAGAGVVRGAGAEVVDGAVRGTVTGKVRGAGTAMDPFVAGKRADGTVVAAAARLPAPLNNIAGYEEEILLGGPLIFLRGEIFLELRFSFL